MRTVSDTCRGPESCAGFCGGSVVTPAQSRRNVRPGAENFIRETKSRPGFRGGLAVYLGAELDRLDLVEHVVGLADGVGRSCEFLGLFFRKVDLHDLLDALAADDRGNADADVRLAVFAFEQA